MPGHYLSRYTTSLILLLAVSNAWADDEFFEARVRPLLANRCYECHQRQAEGGLRLDSRKAIMRGGSHGPAIVSGDPEKSLLMRAVTREHEGLAMPPEDPLDKEEVQVFAKWIRSGAAWPKSAANKVTGQDATDEHGISDVERAFWSFQPIQATQPPHLGTGRIEVEWGEHPIDAFVAQQHSEQGLSPVQLCSPGTLVRRMHFGLIGLPPSSRQVAEFEARAEQDRGQAVRDEIDRLLESSQYGERWAQHWLDLVRYADTAGDAADFPVPEAYKYRNYVIDAFNHDKPYDQFVREQIAGDLMSVDDEAESWQRTVATGYLALSRRVGVTPRPHIIIEDTLNNLGKTFLGLTVGCARCHDHKFDPIQAKDYYALYGIFESSVYPHPGAEHRPHRSGFVYRVGDAKANEAMAPFQAKLDELRSRERATLEEYRDLQRKPESELGYNRAEAWEKLLSVRAEVGHFAKTVPHLETAFAISEGESDDAYVHEFGDPKKKGPVVPRGFLQVLGGQELLEGTSDSGRLQLADWIASPDNPLTARVIVNRVWHHHFGRGIVASTSDFGVRGERPTHPELLDFLAKYLIQSGWSIKQLHRLILTSRTWQLSSHSSEADRSSEIDPENRFLWRANRRRLDAEQLRDTVLMLSNQLDSSPGEAHPFPHRLTYFYRQHEPFVGNFSSQRRSVYLFRQRIRKHRFIDLFDGPDGNLHVGTRRPTTTSLQSLFMLNSEFITKQSDVIAKRLVGESENTEQRIRWLYENVFGRVPREDEVDATARHLEQLQQLADRDGSGTALSSVVQAMLCSNEFLFVD